MKTITQKERGKWLVPCKIQALGNTLRCPGLDGDHHAPDTILWPVIKHNTENLVIGSNKK